MNADGVASEGPPGYPVLRTESNGIGKLLPKSLSARRRKKLSIAVDGGGGDDTPRGRSAASREPTESDGDSDHDSRASSRPPVISTHPSQIGYLTTSSPLVQADHLQDLRPAEQQEPGPPPRPATARADGTDRSEAPSLRSKSSRTGLAPPSSASGRSPSPAGRFRDVFRSRKSSTGTASSSPERPATVPAHVEQAQEDSPTPLVSQPAEDAKAAPADRFRRLSRGRKSEPSSGPPRTPPSGGDLAATPRIVNTPPTPTDPRHPSSSPTRTPTVDANAATDKTDASSPSPSGNMISQRRGRSGSASIVPSKLSNITLAPLSPTPENEPPVTPSAAGFFSSVLSAAQTATNSFSNTITNTNISSWNNNKKAAVPSTAPEPKESQEDKVDDKVEVEPAVGVAPGHPMESNELAVKTLGMGDLSLSQLGIVDQPSSAAPASVASKPSDLTTESRARSDSAPVDNHAVTPIDETQEDPYALGRPRSFNQPGDQGDRTPPAGSVYEGKPGVQRSGSIRSAIGRHRKRGSSAATGGTGTTTTIGAAIAAANASVANPSALAATPKLTGFAVASKKRNRDFHTLFKSVPDDDYLIEDYSCALQREILAHGRLYVSEGHLCFNSNILGWITTLVMSFDEIVSVEKRSTALVFKNGLMISTLHAKHIFASFASRDSTYDLVVKIWKLGHPSLQSSLNGVHIDETGGDKTEKVDIDESVGSQSGASSSEDESEDGDVYDEDEDNEDAPDTTQLTELGTLDLDTERAVTRKPSGAVAAMNGTSAETKPKEAPASTPGEDFPGPATHAPTDCGDAASHYDKIIADDIIPAPLGKTFNLVFGSASVSWLSKWLTNEQKCTELQMEDKKGMSADNKTRTYSYIKPLYASLGPKQTKCIVTEQVENIDFEKAVNIQSSTQNPDVPSGNIFSVKTRYCLSWAEGNATRVQVNCTVEWTGKSWLKGPIEKGVSDGQTQHCKELFASLKAAVSSRPRSGAPANGAAGKGKKKGRKGKAAQASGPASDVEGVTHVSAKQDWGSLEPVHSFVRPVIDIVRPLMTGNVMYGLLVGLLVASWFGFGFNRQAPRHFGQELGYLAYPDRLAAYEEIWRREESELWEWLEERVGLDRFGDDRLHTRKKVLEPRTVEEKLREDRMDEREIREAIKVTEEKLSVLKEVIQKRGVSTENSRAA